MLLSQHGPIGYKEIYTPVIIGNHTWYGFRFGIPNMPVIMGFETTTITFPDGIIDYENNNNAVVFRISEDTTFGIRDGLIFDVWIAPNQKCNQTQIFQMFINGELNDDIYQLSNF